MEAAITPYNNVILWALQLVVPAIQKKILKVGQQILDSSQIRRMIPLHPFLSKKGDESSLVDFLQISLPMKLKTSDQAPRRQHQGTIKMRDKWKCLGKRPPCRLRHSGKLLLLQKLM